MKTLQLTYPRAELHLLLSSSFCNQRRCSSSKARNYTAMQVNLRQVTLLYWTPTLGYLTKQNLSSPRSSKQSVSSFPLTDLNTRQGWDKLSAKEQRIFGGGDSAVNYSMSTPCETRTRSQTPYQKNLIAGMKDKFRKGFRRTGRRRTNLEQRIQKGFQTFGLERQFGELPEWSAYVPVVAGGLEALVIVGWTVALKGDLRGSSMFNLSGEGLLTVLLGTNFVVGWLASQMSTWRVQALPANLLGRDKKAASPNILDFMKSFFFNWIPYGNFLAWTRFAWKENNSVSSLNALVYVVPSLVRLVFWSQGLTSLKVEVLAWLLGAIHRPYDAARVRNERLLAAADARLEKARKAKEEKEREEKGPELTIDDMVLLQQRKELEEFDILLARKTSGNTPIPGPTQDWSVGDTLQWLSMEGFARYASVFAENDIDGAILLLLTADDLRDELGIQSLGDRKKLIQAVKRLK